MKKHQPSTSKTAPQKATYVVMVGKMVELETQDKNEAIQEAMFWIDTYAGQAKNYAIKVSVFNKHKA